MQRKVRALALASMLVVSVFAGTVVFSGAVAAAGNTISGCTTISSGGTYHLDSDVIDSGATACIEIQASDVVFDGQGHTIEGTNATDSRAVDIAAAGSISNVTVRDVTLRDWYDGVYSEAADTAINDSTFDRIIVESFSNMVEFQGADGSVVADNTFTNPPDSNGYVVRAIGTSNLHFVRNDVSNVANGVSVTQPNALIRGNDFDAAGVSVGADSVVADNTFDWDGTGRTVDITDSNTVVRNNDIDNTFQAVLVEDATGVTVSDNEISNVNYAVEAYNLNGPVDDLTVRDNDIDDSSDTAIRLVDGAGSTVEGNTVDDGDGIGINVTQSGSTTIRDNAVRNNALSGIRVLQSDDAVLTNNTVVGNNGGGTFPDAGVYVNASATVVIDDLVARNNRLAGLRIGHADGIEVQDSRITENCGGNYGVSLGESADALFVNTNVSNNTGVGMQVFDGSSGLVVRDSTFNDNGGLGGFQGEPGNTLVNVTANGNTNYGISARGDAVLRDVTARNNGQYGLSVGPNATLAGGTFAGNSGAEVLTGELDATGLQVGTFRLAATNASGVDLFETAGAGAPPPGDTVVASPNLSVAGTPGYLNATLRYRDADVSGLNESTLSVWRFTGGSGWTDIDDTLDTGTNTITTNVTNDGIVAVLAEPASTGGGTGPGGGSGTGPSSGTGSSGNDDGGFPGPSGDGSGDAEESPSQPTETATTTETPTTTQPPETPEGTDDAPTPGDEQGTTEVASDSTDTDEGQSAATDDDRAAAVGEDAADTAAETTGSGPGFGVVAALVAVLAVTLVAARRRD